MAHHLTTPKTCAFAQHSCTCTQVGVYGNAHRLVVAEESGTVRVWRRGADSAATLTDDALAYSFKGSPHATRLALCPDDDSLVAIGGKDCELCVWRLAEGAAELVFKSKNPKPDMLHLHPPRCAKRSQCPDCTTRCFSSYVSIHQVVSELFSESRLRELVWCSCHSS